MVINNALSQLNNPNLFDSDWYEKQYPDVGMSGLSSAEHYLKYGAVLQRDPSAHFSTLFYRIACDLTDKIDWSKQDQVVDFLSLAEEKLSSGKVLTACDQIMYKGFPVNAIKLAEKYLPAEYINTLNILKANEALIEGDKANWLNYLNLYLSDQDISPIALRDESLLISQLNVNRTLKKVSGPKISVIMPVWNSERTVAAAIDSILNQTWENIELIIIDDASSDNTWPILKAFASYDKRIKLHRSDENQGPYVSKNIALAHYVTGEYVTGQDADDWSHPQRLEKHYELVKRSNALASITYMLRLKESGQITKLDPISAFTYDGAARKALISCLFERKFLNETLGYWDSVRFGADSEMLARAEMAAGDRFKKFKIITMLCLDLPTSLTNDPITGIKANFGNISNARAEYKRKWLENHKERSKSQFFLNKF